jgi:hypothetical protein
LGSGVTIAATPTGYNNFIDVIRCDNGNVNYRTERWLYQGTQTTETTIVRTGGASDGTTPISWKFTVNANVSRFQPFEAIPIVVWNDTTGGALTATVFGIWGGGAVPNNNDVWMEVEYLGTSGNPLALFVSSGLADPLAPPASVSTDTSVWGGSTTKFKLVSPSFTPQLKGPIIIRVFVGANATIYIDPKATVA